MQSTREITVSRPKPGRAGPWRTVWSIWTWAEIVVLVITCVALQTLLAPFTWPFDRRRYVTGSLLRYVGVAAAFLTPLWRFSVHGPLPAHKPRRTVVVGNHCSNSDPFLISYLPWEMKWLTKASMFKVPVVGWALRLAGDIPVERGDRSSAEAALARCARWLERGMPVMIFPEGTRSGDGELGAFKDGAFRLAIDTRADVLPIAVAGTSSALPRRSWRLGRARAFVTVGTPITTTGMTRDDVPQLKAIARAQIEELRRSLPGRR